MTDKLETVWSECILCARKTEHTICYKESESPEHYNATTYFMFVKCRGCGTRSYREEYHDWEAMNTDWEGNIIADEASHVYPPVLLGRRQISNTHCLPDAVRKIYVETYSAVAGGNFTLSGMGLRATVEAICNHQGIKGNDLAKRISKLRISGILGKKDVDRLHGIRFLGNDAAHEIKTAKAETVLLALDIIEHALRSLYIFDDEGSVLELPFNDYEEVKDVLVRSLKTMAPGTYTLTKWLGDHTRRLCDRRDEFEKATVDAVNAGTFPGITLGAPIPGRPGAKPMQTYTKA